MTTRIFRADKRDGTYAHCDYKALSEVPLKTGFDRVTELTTGLVWFLDYRNDIPTVRRPELGEPYWRLTHPGETPPIMDVAESYAEEVRNHPFMRRGAAL